MNKIENSPIVISGPSGAGKSELIEYVEKKYPTFLEATGITTREKRKVEVGRMYFVSKEEFQQLIISNDLIEYCVFNNNYYGVPKSEFEKLKEYHLMFNVGYSSAREIKNIYDDKLAIEEEKEKIQKNSNQIELLRKSLERDNSKLNAEAENIVADAKFKARNILLDAKEEANDIIRELNKESTNVKIANSMRNKLNKSIDSLSETHEYEQNATKLKTEDIFIGKEVLCKNLNSHGTVLSLPNKSSEVKVQIGSLTMNIKLDDLADVAISNTKNSSVSNFKSKASFNNNLKAKNVASEINVIGLNVDQAIPIVDKYLDDCYMANLESARIVHGKGTGRLRDGIHSFLKKNPHVKSYRMGTYGEGEMGVTVVYLR